MQANDFLTFDKFLTPQLIKFVYWAGLIVIGLCTLFSMLGFGKWHGMLHFFFALLGGVLLALVWRIVCEFWSVIFSIHDRLGIIAGQKSQ